MKSLIGVMALASATAFACPDLTGSYPTCTFTSNDSPMKLMKDVLISQSTEADGSVRYTIAADIDGNTEPDVYVTNGQPYTINTEMKSVARCEGDKILAGEIKAVVEGELMTISEVEYTKLSEKELYFFLTSPLGNVTAVCK